MAGRKAIFSSNSEGTFFTGHLVMQTPQPAHLALSTQVALSDLDLELAHAAAHLFDLVQEVSSSMLGCWATWTMSGVKIQA